MTRVISPCVSICKLDEDDICIGCGRTLEELRQWPTASVPRQRQIVRQAAARLCKAGAQESR
ncbi:MAG: DUF1289 domain-containing protein [Ectothiorhodospiraceae bacterium]|nr:DUF1289 domain-containing protein [Ectothiorhodospiraceae bacterium]